MHAMTVNSQTGFLESNGSNSFDSMRKVRFLELGKEVRERGGWPNVSELCKVVGIDYQTFNVHLNMDEAFRRAWNEVKMSAACEIESKMFEFAQNKGNYMDRITWLRKNVPEQWNPEYKLSISSDSTQLKGLADSAQTVIEADIVEEPKAIATHLQPKLDSPSEK